MDRRSRRPDCCRAAGDRGAAQVSNHPPTFILAGFAKLPAKVPGGLTLELEVDPYDMRIVDAACCCPPALGQKLLVGLLVGRTLDDLEGAIGQIRAQEAIYGTRPWYTFGEGPTIQPEGHFRYNREFLKIVYSAQDVRYTTSDKTITFPAYFNGFESRPFNTKENRDRHPREA